MAPKPSPEKRGRPHDLSCVLVLLLLCCLFFHEVILSPGKMLYYLRSDLCRFLVPKVTFIVESWRGEGVLPLWEPLVYSGKPPFGVPQLGVFYPFFLFVALFSTTCAYGYLFALHYVIGGLGMFLFIREISGRRKQAFLSAVVFVFSGYMSARVLSGQYWHLCSMSWIPFVFLFAERSVRRPGTAPAALLGGALAMQFTAGHTQYFFYTVFVLFFYLLFRLASEWRAAGPPACFRALLPLAFSAALFFLLSGVQLLPSLEYSRYVYRANMYDFKIASDFRLLPGDLPTLVFPNIRGSAVDFSYWGSFNFWEVCAYAGLLPLMLAAISLARCRNRYNTFFLCLLLFSLLFSMDGRIPVFSFCYYHLPWFNLFRCPARMLAMYVFALAAVAGYGFSALCDGLRGRPVRRLLLFFCALFTALLGAVAAFALFGGPATAAGKRIVAFVFSLDPGGAHTRSLAEWQELVPLYYAKIRVSLVSPGQLGVLIAAIAAAAVLLARRVTARTALAVICAATLFDLWSFGMPMIGVESPGRVYRRGPAVRFLMEDGDLFRIHDCAGAASMDIAEQSGIFKIEGFESTFLREYREFLTCLKFDEKRWLGLDTLDYETRNYLGSAGIDFDSIVALEDNLNLLNLLNVKYLLTGVPLHRAGLELVFSGERTAVDDDTLESAVVPVYIYRNDEMLPRAFVAGDAVIADGGEEVLRLLKMHDPGRVAVLQAPAGEMGGGGHTEALVTEYSPNRIEAAVDLDEPGILVLSEIWYPGWRAVDNGDRELPVLKVDHCLRGVYLGPGTHRVVFEYRPASFYAGRALSIIGVALFCVSLLLSRIRRRRGGP